MIINSPVGRFPFEIKRLTFSDGRIRMHGAMGAWPTSVEVAPSELPHIIWRLVGPGGVVAVLLPAGLALKSLLRRSGRG